MSIVLDLGFMSIVLDLGSEYCVGYNTLFRFYEYRMFSLCIMDHMQLQNHAELLQRAIEHKCFY